ncbi:hypothetical protein Q9L58_000963 [Maublancomyces gigas]|uniref:Uncharacterized protein n=1 Tax=Discina gigas TaxID=1032678 RepID=A0ABR3GVA8_9PEZI
MASPSRSDHPPLSPQFSFLHVSRSTIDDTISQNLNSLNTPASRTFDPSSTARRFQTPRNRSLPAASCRTFTEHVLLPSWQSRSDVLNYCASVAASDDPDDPDSVVRIATNTAGQERVVDERLDPYSGKFYPRESRTEILARVIRNERLVEDIIRERSWRIVGEKCEEFGGVAGDWRKALDEWRKRKVAGKEAAERTLELAQGKKAAERNLELAQ